MRLTKLKLASRVFGLILGATVAGTSGTANADYLYLSGSSCQAANNAQANSLSWNHYRIANYGFAPRWVVCPFDTSYGYNGAVNDYQDTFRLGTYHQNTAAQVRCILRRYPMTQTNAAVPFQQRFIAGNAALVQGLDTNFTNANMKGFGAKTMTCLLPRNTGINMMIGYD